MSPKLKELLFPNENRTFWGKRWVKVILLNLHLCGVCGFVAGKLFNVDVVQLRWYIIITMISGLILVTIEIYSNCIWLIQNRGWMILLKVFLLTQLSLFFPYEKWGLLFIVFLSGWVSHAKGDFRYYSIFHRKRMDTYGGQNGREAENGD